MHLDRKLPPILLLLIIGIMIWSGYGPLHRTMWFYEASFTFILLLLFVVSYRFFQWTNITYCIAFFSIVSMLIGSHYTYAEMPFFHFLSDRFGESRNHFDRFGHIFLGMFTYLCAREYFIRQQIMKSNWVTLSSFVYTLAIAAGYELVEFSIPYIAGTNIHVFLAEQGDVWDSHWDIVMAIVGAMISYLAWQPLQNQQLASFKSKEKN
ncbi:DUF2238 domain-containing protein [Hazenella sp. IB182357]|uniref:DUF2238 domain-containing protein n=1 Tax=Polycladospora coralii TaxID=2771432 RepID=A0A926N4S8_9BACL|nr:DUF2238 domain-containing protein [Polycladospora coralii]MBD1370939.1 DUF2238 domain-containing protein [Polycladospora coralii]MBS7529878.1 DUF2238 domain-containing protein [Polycladospora coralii]